MSRLFAVLAILGAVLVCTGPTPAAATQRPDGARAFDFTDYEISAHRRYYHRRYYRPYRYGYYRPYYRPYRYGYYRPWRLYRPYYGYYRPWGGYYGFYRRPAIGFGFYW
jgi:hypothetical protein